MKFRRKNLIGIILYLFIFISCNEKNKSEAKLITHKINPNIQRLVDSLSVLEIVGYENRENIRYQAFFKETAVSDLIFLTDYKVPEIRCYAFSALAEKNYPKIKEIFFKHIHDTAMVKAGGGCIIGSESVASYMLQQIHPALVKVKYRFSRKEFDKIFEQTEKQEKKLKPKPEINWNDSIKKMQSLDLFHTQEYYWADSNDPDFQKKRQLVGKPIHFVKFDENIIATAYFEVNGCNSHFPNIVRKGDTIILQNKIFHKSVCDIKFRRIDKINFFISDIYITKIKTVITEQQASH